MTRLLFLSLLFSFSLRALFHDRARGYLFRPFAITPRALSGFLDVLILPLFLAVAAAQMSFRCHRLTFSVGFSPDLLIRVLRRIRASQWGAVPMRQPN